MFLAGAPGAGKGEMGAFIRKIRGITTDIIETSKLLQSPEAAKVKEEGGLVASRQVVQILLKKLLEPELSNGVIVDGFPRTKVQGECIKLLYDRMIDYKKKYDKTTVREAFNRPVFHIMVLFIEEAVSIERQLSRGAKVREHNRRVAETGFGELLPIRNTDEDADLARHRYREFKEHIYQSMQTVKEYFHFHFVLADAHPDVVKARILKELEYQSSVELSESTFEQVRQLPLANEVIRGARQKLTRRLEDYARNHAVLFDKVIKHLLENFFTIIKYNVLSGKTVIRTEHPLFEEEYALRMSIDLLCERGFSVYVDVQRRLSPERLENDTIIKRTFKVYQFTIEFNKPTIRSNSQIMI